MKIKSRILLCALLPLIGLIGCRKDDIIYPPEETVTGQPQLTSVSGFYLLNEGNMGSNKATLDYYDYAEGKYTRNIYGAVNPEVPMEMGDVGNDLQIYGSRLYAVVNCSNKVEVMEAATARRIGQIEIPNCRFIAFHEGYAYVTSYAGPVEIRPDYSQKGFVAKVDTATLEVVDRCLVGFQPDGIAVSGGKLYVCNSGGYMVPNYENTVSVIDIASFTEERRIPVAVNLSLIRADSRGVLWISSRGDYYNVASRLYAYDTVADRLVADLDVAVSDMDLCGDILYVVSAAWSYETMSNAVTNAVVDTRTFEKVSDSFITDGTEKNIQIPYCVKVNPVTKEILVTDARNYVNPGWLYCYSPEGVLQWSVRTGDIPAHICFTGKYR